jgi:hypothetical protein
MEYVRLGSTGVMVSRRVARPGRPTSSPSTWRLRTRSAARRKTAEAVPGQPASLRCQVSSASGYVGPLHLKVLTIDPNGPRVTVAPGAVQVGPGGTAEVTVEFASEPATARDLSLRIGGSRRRQGGLYGRHGGNAAQRHNDCVGPRAGLAAPVPAGAFLLPRKAPGVEARGPFAG